MIKQSFSYWCVTDRGYEPAALLAGAAKIGYTGVDLIDESLWPLVRKAGLELAAVNGHGTIDDGLNREENFPRIEKEIRAQLAKAKEWKFSALICFSGQRRGLSDEAGLEQCAKSLKRLAPLAEDAGVVLAVELLNSKVDHRDYQCDHTGWGVELCQRVGSPAVKLLYDIYHMQIMEGDLIRNIREEHGYFAHYHTAGNPGRGQPDETQEIYYPAVYRAIAETGYNGYIAHEFIPKGDPLAAFEKAYRDCAAALA
jgi:hydroxypyruvate isomerase